MYRSRLSCILQTLLKTTIETASTTCTQSMFIFDEIDKMPIGLIDVLKPYLDFHAKVDGNDYRSNIFVFLRYGHLINTKHCLFRHIKSYEQDTVFRIRKKKKKEIPRI